ncbi:hypothetical protein BS47DRAFT_1363792 [Hydnum rufescens UP504]|uniref:Pre-mRNA-splicing factor SYF2 n=1 Tax=Hydnum rufescens UP504 TaxID=1448309 RepID=A0A9P6DUE2_9AGAM|nr:hypothetical protein BS47DRAFT_1363792 [Hydnum rufescens UP504]
MDTSGIVDMKKGERIDGKEEEMEDGVYNRGENCGERMDCHLSFLSHLWFLGIRRSHIIHVILIESGSGEMPEFPWSCTFHVAKGAYQFAEGLLRKTPGLLILKSPARFPPHYFWMGGSARCTAQANCVDLIEEHQHQKTTAQDLAQLEKQWHLAATLHDKTKTCINKPGNSCARDLMRMKEISPMHNEVFNKKITRYYDVYTKEIRDGFEWGTALVAQQIDDEFSTLLGQGAGPSNPELPEFSPMMTGKVKMRVTVKINLWSMCTQTFYDKDCPVVEEVIEESASISFCFFKSLGDHFSQLWSIDLNNRANTVKTIHGATTGSGTFEAIRKLFSLDTCSLKECVTARKQELLVQKCWELAKVLDKHDDLVTKMDASSVLEAGKWTVVMSQFHDKYDLAANNLPSLPLQGRAASETNTGSSIASTVDASSTGIESTGGIFTILIEAEHRRTHLNEGQQPAQLWGIDFGAAWHPSD